MLLSLEPLHLVHSYALAVVALVVVVTTAAAAAATAAAAAAAATARREAGASSGEPAPTKLLHVESLSSPDISYMW